MQTTNNLNDLDLDLTNLQINSQNKEDVKIKFKKFIVAAKQELLSGLNQFEKMISDLEKSIQISSKGNAQEREKLPQIEKIKNAMRDFKPKEMVESANSKFDQISVLVDEMISSIDQEDYDIGHIENIVNLVTDMYLENKLKQLDLLNSILKN